MDIEVREVKTRKEQKEFIDFPLRLYRGNPYYVPPIYMDEKKLFNPDFAHYETCEVVFYNAYINGKIAGRIAGILQKAANEKWGEKRVRFNRFDTINDRRVAKALLDKVEEWAKNKGMEEVVGPLGFTDQDREGLLIEGFNELSCFEEQYSYEYYKDLIEYCGYKKEVDWLEFKISLPDDNGEELQKLADFAMKRYNLRFSEAKTVDEFIDKYAMPFIDMIDERYSGLYGSTPLTAKARDNMLKDFGSILNVKYCDVLLDENDKVVSIGLCIPSIAKAIQKSYGHLTPAAIYRIKKAVKNPEIVDLAFIAVSPEYVNKGVNAAAAARICKILREDGVKYAESLLCLEYNTAILQQWNRFNKVQHKRRRSFVKALSADDGK